MKKEYTNPYTEIIRFQQADFIVTSQGGDIEPDPGRGDYEKVPFPELDPTTGMGLE